MYYEINVAKDGKHVFATAPRSIQTSAKATRLYKQFLQAFPDHEVTVSRCEEFSITLTHEQLSE